ncbi:rRNA adenine N-6-methyltransferase family protein [uncultured Clostridium sp.]|uniref:class I SAM-dependent methyltransferase n=1 Tax=uncultured Clostridium sp. TaxID=59620 RepID=UPI0028F027FD|nr:rRNA adenine N-6-methyltransferase family protein [uncultured Clostridium sp.]
MERLSFVKQYITKTRTVGAILPSSKYLANKMIENIDFNCASYIVEYGPGTGVFTEKMIKKRKRDTIILLFESNKEFCNLLKEKYKNEPNLYIINDSAEYIEKYIIRYDIPWIDYIVSGLPFASLPHNVSSNILKQTQNHLKEDGKFITFQYTLLKKDFIGQYFKEVGIKREVRNIPPAYVFCCSL